MSSAAIADRDPLRPAIVCSLFLLPLVLGLVFWADSSGTPDAAFYRQMIRHLDEQGFLPLSRLIWYHPGHYLLVWPVYALGKALGLWEDPQRAISLVNFLSLGFASVTLHRSFELLFPGRDRSIPLLAGLALATCPGWLWQAQDGMSDIVGHSLVLICAARLVQHQIRNDCGLRPLFVTGFLAGFAILIRLSSVLFLPMLAFLLLRVLAGSTDHARRRRVLFGFILGWLTPIACVFTHLLWHYGFEQFAQIYFGRAEEMPKAEHWQRLPENLTIWFSRIERGMGPVSLCLALAGCLGLAAAGLGRDRLRILTSRRPLFLCLVLLYVPFLCAVAVNRAPGEFRYQLPAMALLSLGIPSLGLLLGRCAGAWGPRLLVPLLAGANLAHAYPQLEVLRSRSHFIEVGARALTARAPESALLVGIQAPPFFGLFAAGQTTLSVKPTAADTEFDHWNRPWSLGRLILASAASNGREVYCINEVGLVAFRRMLVERGWKEETVQRISFSGLRNRWDASLPKMDTQMALRGEDLRLIRLVPPSLPPPLRLLARRSSPGKELQLELWAAELARRPYRILIGKRTRAGGIRLGHVLLPFDEEDAMLGASVAFGDQPDRGVEGLRGVLDAGGAAKARIPAELASGLVDHVAVGVVFERVEEPDSALASSRPLELR